MYMYIIVYICYGIYIYQEGVLVIVLVEGLVGGREIQHPSFTRKATCMKKGSPFERFRGHGFFCGI